MYAMHSPTSPRNAFAASGAYRNIGVETGVTTASPHRLVTMLFDGLQESLAQARGAIRAGQIETKGRAVRRAVRIVEEGLKAGLDLSAGGALAADLRALYDYLALRITQANLKNDDSMFAECQRLIEPIASAWAAIEPGRQAA